MIKRIQMRKVRKIIIIGVIIIIAFTNVTSIVNYIFIIAWIVSANIFLKKGPNNINIDEH